MPTYQYRCAECGRDLEAVQKFTDPALTECPECEGTLRKVFSAVGVVFKGSGFYATDNRTNGSANASRAGTSKSDSKSSADTAKGTSSDTAATSGSASSDKGAVSAA